MSYPWFIISFMSNTTPAMPDLPRPENVVITSEAWTQILSHMPMTEERKERDRHVAGQRQRGVEDLLREDTYPTAPLRLVKRIAPPSPGMEIVDTFARYDGEIVACWRDESGSCAITIETELTSTPGISEDLFPGDVSYVVPLPGGNWLGTAARVDLADDDTDGPITAWVVSPQGDVLASGCLGDAATRPVVGSSGQIWVTYFDEKPWRGSDGAWHRTAADQWEFIEGSVIKLEDVAEESPYGRYTAGYTGMTVYDNNLRVVDRHDGTDICEVYTNHTDGDRFWYVSYPDWVIDSHGPDGQHPPIPDPSHKGMPLIASGDRIARFSGDGRHRDSLFVRLPDGTEAISIVTFPDGRPLERGGIATWGPYLHYFDGLDWYVVNVFGAEPVTTRS